MGHSLHVWLSAFALLWGTHVAQAQDRVFLLGGQSNMAGFGTSLEALPAPYSDVQPQVRIWNFLANDWADLEPGYGSQFGPELSFGYTLAAQDPGRTVYLVKHAVNGTSLYEDWQPGSGFQWSLFRSIVTAALGNLDAAGVAYQVEGMLWMQGESDALEGQGASYEHNLRDFIEAVRVLIAAPELPFVLGRIAVFFGDEANSSAVRSAQQFVAESTPGAAWFDTDDLELVNFGHYDSLGQVALGKRFAGGWLGVQSPGTWTDLGFALAAGSADAPLLTGSGSLLGGELLELSLAGGPGSSPALLIWSDTVGFTPILGGLAVPDPFSGGGWLLAATDTKGACRWSATWPPDAPAGLELTYQAWLPATDGPQGWLASNAVLSRAP
ncbi:MAG: sialate O-acetylesterase [Planctomycetota bacterium]|jgi:hypothetical protein